ncbi:MAG: hypothetical protein D6679_06900 [Candidatus Hydrogenedentota bacterium]|nr:MAG: hypothetical protein D6679_06900 [Candidatus Hydrogenedentota bacterium]
MHPGHCRLWDAVERRFSSLQWILGSEGSLVRGSTAHSLRSRRRIPSAGHPVPFSGGFHFLLAKRFFVFRMPAMFGRFGG